MEVLRVCKNRLRMLFAEKSDMSGVSSLKIGQDVPLDLLTYTVLSVHGVKCVTWLAPSENNVVPAYGVARLNSLSLRAVEAMEI